jgi:hypothetical protein
VPYWAVVIVIVVLVVVYYSSTSYARDRRRDRVGTSFAKIPGFHANQLFIDVHGETAVGVDDRGRRIGVSRKRGEPRVRTYSFAQLVSAELIENDQVMAKTSRGGRPEGTLLGDSLFGSTGRTRGPAGVTPGVTRAEGMLSLLGVRIVFDGPAGPGVFVRFYQGKPVAVTSLAADRAYGQARSLFGALEIALRRAAMPPRQGPVPVAPERSERQ